MVKVTFLPSNRTIEYDPVKLPFQREGMPGSILDIALNYGVEELRHSCGGICACITCHVIVKDGGRNLSPMQPDEEDRIYRIPAYTLQSRLACRAVPTGEITVLIPSKGDTRG